MIYTLILSLLVYPSVAVMAASLTPTPSTAPKPSPAPIKRVIPESEVRYFNALQLEQLKLFGQAKVIYSDQVKSFIKQAEGSRAKDTLIPHLPLVISAAYRLSIVNARDNYYQVHPLVHQMDSFQDVQQQLDQLIQLLGEMRRHYSHVIPRQQYESLFFARAYNRLAWANKLLVATAWKHYIVYPPSDILSMVDMAISDLDQLLQFQEFPPSLSEFSGDPQSVLIDRFQDRFSPLSKEGGMYKTYSLSNGEDDPAKLSRLLAKRTINQVYATLALYRSSNTKVILEAAKQHYTLDKMLSESNQPTFKLMGDLVQTIGVL